jgi:hypothetical protein
MHVTNCFNDSQVSGALRLNGQLRLAIWQCSFAASPRPSINIRYSMPRSRQMQVVSRLH